MVSRTTDFPAKEVTRVERLILIVIYGQLVYLIPEEYVLSYVLGTSHIYGHLLWASSKESIYDRERKNKKPGVRKH